MKSVVTGGCGFIGSHMVDLLLSVVPGAHRRRRHPDQDFVFVTDVVRANLRAARSDCVGEIFNVGTSVPQSVNRLVELLGGGVPVSRIVRRLTPSKFEGSSMGTSRVIRSWGPGDARQHRLLAGCAVVTEENIREATREWSRSLGSF